MRANALSTRLAALALGAFVVAGAPAETLRANAIGATFSIPEPKGFGAMKNEKAPLFANLRESQARNRHVLLAVMLRADAVAKADAGEPHTSESMAIAFVGTHDGERRITAKEFEATRDEQIAGIEKMLATKFNDEQVARSNAVLGAMLKEPGSRPETLVASGPFAPLGLYAREKNYFTYGLANRTKRKVGDRVEEVPLVTILSTVAVRDRVLTLVVYRNLQARADIDEAKATMAAWVRDVLHANR